MAQTTPIPLKNSPFFQKFRHYYRAFLWLLFWQALSKNLAVGFALGCCLVFLPLPLPLPLTSSLFLYYSLYATSSCLLLAFAYLLYQHPSPFHVCQFIDRQEHLHDQITSAYQLKGESEMEQLLHHRASTLLPSHPPQGRFFYLSLALFFFLLSLWGKSRTPSLPHEKEELPDLKTQLSLHVREPSPPENPEETPEQNEQNETTPSLPSQEPKEEATPLPPEEVQENPALSPQNPEETPENPETRCDELEALSKSKEAPNEEKQALPQPKPETHQEPEPQPEPHNSEENKQDNPKPKPDPESEPKPDPESEPKPEDPPQESKPPPQPQPEPKEQSNPEEKSEAEKSPEEKGFIKKEVEPLFSEEFLKKKKREAWLEGQKVEVETETLSVFPGAEALYLQEGFPEYFQQLLREYWKKKEENRK
jgi:hypothetical protein